MQWHKNVPRGLRRAFRANGCKYHATAKVLGVNSAHIHNLIIHGKEPKDKDIRIRLFLDHVKPAWVAEATRNLRELLELANA